MSKLRTIVLVISVVFVLLGTGGLSLFLVIKNSSICYLHENEPDSASGNARVDWLPPSYTCEWRGANDEQLLEITGHSQSELDKVQGPHTLIWPYIILAGLIGLVAALSHKKKA